MRASAEIGINKPVAEVWAFVLDVRTMDRWVTGVGGAHQTSDGPLAVGSAAQSEYRYAGKTHEIKYTVTALEPNGRLTLKATSGPFPLVWSVALQRDGGGTRLRNTVDAGADSLITALMFLAMWPMFRFGMKRGIRQDLKRLKAALEEETT